MKPHLVSSPATLEPQRAWGQVHLRLEPGDDAPSVIPRFAARVALRRLDLPAAMMSAALLEHLPGGLRVVAHADRDAAPRLDQELHEAGARAAINLWAAPTPMDAESITAATRATTAAGWPVLVEPRPDAVTGRLPLLELLDHYLFHPSLEVPIEPFHSLLQTLNHRSGRTLWNIWFGSPLDYFHLDRSGMVSLCASWVAEPAKRYGTCATDVRAWRESAAHRQLQDRIERFPEGDEPCHSCRGASLCGGALLALHEDADCELWCELFERIRIALAARRARSLT